MKNAQKAINVMREQYKPQSMLDPENQSHLALHNQDNQDLSSVKKFQSELAQSEQQPNIFSSQIGYH